MNEAQLYAACLEQWGIVAQMGMLQEECAELIVAVNKWNRGKPGALQKIGEELADVQNMINQLKILCPNFEEVRLAKLERVKELLKLDIKRENV